MLVRMPINRIVPRLYHQTTDHVHAAPYFYRHYLIRAHTFAHWGLDGLAVGDAYKTLLLIDEVLDDSGEYHELALEAEEAHPLREREEFGSFSHQSLPTWIFDHPAAGFDWRSIDGSRLLAYRLLVYLLTNIGCLRSAWDFHMQLANKDINGHEHGHGPLKDHLLCQIRSTLGQTEAPTEDPKFSPEDLPDRGFVQRILYPWNTFEPQRYSESNLRLLNEALARVASKLRAEITELPVLSSEGAVKYEKQLGLIAAEEIRPGEEILRESSFLTANNRLYDPLCDACSCELPTVNIGEEGLACPECDDTVFCSQRCLDGAMKSYHPAVCGSDADTMAKEPIKHEAADALYFLLVGRALAFSEHQERHPLDLTETQFLWGEFVQPEVDNSDSEDSAQRDSAAMLSTRPSLPFTFKYNVLYPLNYLEKMDIDVYATISKFDFWIFETLFAKFRGVASGRVSAEGVPEVSAVHWLWCLANHSCNPNVRWEWSGDMRFWARTKEEMIKWGDPPVQSEGGMGRGEDILSHYCDIDLDVQQRREWAQGALGGDCRCARCLWESGE